MLIPESEQNTNKFNLKNEEAETVDTLEVVRTYMNGAVCIASSVNNSILANARPNSDTTCLSRKRINCTCALEYNCKFHENKKKSVEREQSDKRLTQITNFVVTEDEKSKSSSPLTVTEVSDNKKLEYFKNWILKKNKEKKRDESFEMQLKEQEEIEKQKRLDQERENFKKWLTNKKREEEKKNCEKIKEAELERKKLLEREHHNKECELRYQLWLKRKEQEYLEKKLMQHFEALQVTDDKQRRIRENEKAYEIWLKNSVNKPKPLPTGRGLDSLRSSVSVTYINPIPWTPNIETNSKPTSQ